MPYNWQINVNTPTLLAGMSFKVRYRQLPSTTWTLFLPNPTTNIFTIPDITDGTWEVEIITVCANGALSPPRYHQRSFGNVCCAPIITGAASTVANDNLLIVNDIDTNGGIINSISPAFFVIVDGVLPVNTGETAGGTHNGFIGDVVINITGGATFSCLKIEWKKNGVTQDVYDITSAGALDYHFNGLSGDIAFGDTDIVTFHLYTIC